MMKQIVTVMMLMLAALTATAQDNKGEALNEEYFNAKVREMVYRLNITDEQKAKFVPIYRRYCEEMRSVMGPRKKRDAKSKDQRATGEQQRKQLTDEEKLARTKQRMERQQQAQTIRLKYVDEFAKVLSAHQVSKFYEVEDRIQKKLMQRRQHHRANKRDKRNPRYQSAS
jgi:Spy/CpxP family protein refolding chaperone